MLNHFDNSANILKSFSLLLKLEVLLVVIIQIHKIKILFIKIITVMISRLNHYLLKINLLLKHLDNIFFRGLRFLTVLPLHLIVVVDPSQPFFKLILKFFNNFLHAALFIFFQL